MASDAFSISLDGVDQLKAALADAAKTIRTKAVRGALREAANIIKREAQSNAPVLKTARPYRKPGTVKKAISVRPSKFARKEKNEGVYVSVRPLRGARTKKLGMAGAKNPNDPYYWRFVEFGTAPHKIKPGKGKKLLKIGAKFVPSVDHPGTKAQRFMTRASESAGPEAISVFMRSVVPQIERLNAKASRVR